MVAAYHLVWSVYGSWLPNDPRGSGSHEVRSPVLAEVGELHHGRKRIQPCAAELRRFYEIASPLLKHPLLSCDEDEVRVIGDVFDEVIRRECYTCYACAIMPDHVHILIRKHRDLAEQMIANLQKETRDKLWALGLRAGDHPVWGGPGWKVYLDTSDDIERTIRYVVENPVKIRRPAQVWPFVKAYDGWLPGVRGRRR